MTGSSWGGDSSPVVAELAEAIVVWGVYTYLTIMALCAVSLGPAPTKAEAKVLHSREEALTLAFPDAERVERRTLSLSEEERKRVATLAMIPIEAREFTVYVGYKGEQVLGYAFLETRNVRTLPGTFLIVLSPTGVVQRVQVVAFYEPEEYVPAERWLRQFEHKTLTPELRLRRDLHGIAGATLSAQAVTGAVRQALALFQVVIQERH